MTPVIITRATDFPQEKSMIDREIEKNIHGKLDAYLKKFTTLESETRIETTLTRDTKKNERLNTTYSGKVEIRINGKSFLAKRENYEKLEDLINHLFTHIKTQMGK